MKNDSWPEESGLGVIPTKNNTGFMMTYPKGASPDFIEMTRDCAEPMADIGCAYGIAALAALEHSSGPMLAMDLSKDHLDILKKAVPQKDQKRVEYVHGHFPKDFNVDDNYFRYIHISHMLHFLNGEETLEGLSRLYKALKPGGTLFINTCSTEFQPLMHVVKDILEEQKDQDWPGMIDHLPERVSGVEKDQLPAFIHLHTLEGFSKLLEDAGFGIKKAFHFDLVGEAHYLNNDRGILAFVAQKN